MIRGCISDCNDLDGDISLDIVNNKNYIILAIIKNCFFDKSNNELKEF